MREKCKEIAFFNENFFHQNYDFWKLINFEESQNNFNEKQISRTLRKKDQIEFNVFELWEFTDHNELFVFVNFILSIENLFETCTIEPQHFKNFIYMVQKTYNPVTYHN